MFNSQTRKGPELVADAGMKCVVMEQMEQWTEVIVVNTIVFFFVAIAIRDPHQPSFHHNHHQHHFLAFKSWSSCQNHVAKVIFKLLELISRIDQ